MFREACPERSRRAQHDRAVYGMSSNETDLPLRRTRRVRRENSSAKIKLKGSHFPSRLPAVHMHVGTKNFSIFVEKENDSTIRALLRKESHASFSRLSPTQGERTEVRGFGTAPAPLR